MKSRRVHIDMMECIAILFVIIYHTMLYSSDIIEDGSLSTNLSYFFNTILSTCVPIFFFVNGYLLLNKEFNLKKHIHRTIRYIFITVIWAIIYVLVYIPSSGENYSLRTVVMSVLNMDSRMRVKILWFMGAIVCIYILFPAIKALFDSNKKAFVVFVITCSILTFGMVLGQETSDILSSLLNHRISLVNHDFIKMFNPFRGIYGYSIVYFCVGGIAFTLEEKILSIKPIKRNMFSVIGIMVSCSSLFCLGQFYSNNNGKTWDVVWYGYDTIFTFVNVVFIYILCLNYKKDISVIYTISNNTLGIYLIHQLFNPFISSWLVSFDFMRNVPMSILYALIVLCISLALSLLINKVSRIKLFGKSCFYWLRL